MSSGRILIIDDDMVFRFAIGKALKRLDYEVLEATGGEEALVHLKGPKPPDAALLDLRMQGMGGIDVLKKKGNSPTSIIVLTGHGTVRTAVEAIQLGAFSFMEKPVDGDLIHPLLQQAIQESKRLRGDTEGDVFVPPLVGESDGVKGIRTFISRVGPSEETVAIYGETGTGKEVVARHIHFASPRAKGPFIALNAATLPKDLFESELFGHRKGAFTGATQSQKGLFKAAEGGTLFIDEVAELPLGSQAKLLRVLESRTIRPVGETKEVPINARIVVATNRDLWAEVQGGRFREDLYFRLQVFPVVIPPLRLRAGDVPLLSAHLLERIGGQTRNLSEGAIEILKQHGWPGNVRELLNVLRRASLFAEGTVIKKDLAERMVAASIFGHMDSASVPPSQPENSDKTQAPPSIHTAAIPPAKEPADHADLSLADVERSHIEKVLASHNGNVTQAALTLQIDRRTLQRKLKAFGIQVNET